MDKVASEGDIPYISQQIGSWPSIILCSLKTLSGTLWVWKFHLIAKNVHFLSKAVATKTKNTNDNWKPKSEKSNTGPQTPPETQSPFPLRFWNRVPEILVSIYHWSLKAKGYKIALAIIQGSVLRGLGKLMNKGELVWGNGKPRVTMKWKDVSGALACIVDLLDFSLCWCHIKTQRVAEGQESDFQQIGLCLQAHKQRGQPLS